MTIFKATRKYEAWLRAILDVFDEDLALKSQLLAQDPFTFLRGTFYRWIQWRLPRRLSGCASV